MLCCVVLLIVLCCIVWCHTSTTHTRRPQRYDVSSPWGLSVLWSTLGHARASDNVRLAVSKNYHHGDIARWASPPRRPPGIPRPYDHRCPSTPILPTRRCGLRAARASSSRALARAPRRARPSPCIMCIGKYKHKHRKAGWTGRRGFPAVHSAW